MWDKLKDYAKKIGEYLKKTGREAETDIHDLVSKQKKK